MTPKQICDSVDGDGVVVFIIIIEFNHEVVDLDVKCGTYVN